VGFGLSPVTGFAVLSLSFLIQQVENYFLVPKVMEKSAGLSPVVTLLVLLIGLKLGGIVGAMLSVPVLITLRVILREYLPAGKGS
jgi:predicted PurR-regulated permease PerM